MTNLSGLGSLLAAATSTPGKTAEPKNIDQLRSQARDFEAVYLNTLMKQMFSSVSTDKSAFGGGFAEETWRGMQAEQLSAQIAQSGGVGIAEAILPDLIAMQEAAQKTQTPMFQGYSR